MALSKREILVPSAARTVSGTSGIIKLAEERSSGDFWPAVAGVIMLDVTAASGTTPTLDLFIQEILPDGVSVNDWARFAQVTAAGQRVIRAIPTGSGVEGVKQDAAMAAGNPKAGPIPTTLQVKWVIGGTTPSFTFSVQADFYRPV